MLKDSVLYLRFALSNSVIVFLVSLVVSKETTEVSMETATWRHYFWSNLRIFKCMVSVPCSQKLVPVVFTNTLICVAQTRWLTFGIILHVLA